MYTGSVRDGSASTSLPNGMKQRAPFEVHEYTPLESRLEKRPGCVVKIRRKRRTRMMWLDQRIFGQVVDDARSARVSRPDLAHVLWRKKQTRRHARQLTLLQDPVSEWV